jgi:hypothetical protein
MEISPRGSDGGIHRITLIGSREDAGEVSCPGAVTFKPAFHDTHLSKRFAPQELAPFRDG